MKTRMSIFSLLIFLSSCIGGGNQFSGLDDVEVNTGEITRPIEILNYYPTDNPAVINDETKYFNVVLRYLTTTSITYQTYLDNALVSTSTSSYYGLDGSLLSSGNHTLKMVASDGSTSDDQTWTVRKNQPPTLFLSSLSPSPATIFCNGDIQTLTLLVIDPESDLVTYEYLLNGAVNNTYVQGSSTAVLSTLTFTPDCSLEGIQKIAIRATDYYGGSSIYETTVTVRDPYVAEILAYSPVTNPVEIESSDIVNFSITGSGTPPLNYVWAINPGSSIAACNNSGSCPISGSDFSPGTYTLTITLSDASASSDSHSYNVFINGIPTVTSNSPSTASTLKFNCAEPQVFNINFTDANYPSQTYTVTWKLDDLTNAALVGSSDTSTSAMTSTATFTPNCDSSLIGAHTITADVSDGLETHTVTWSVESNYFSTVCNNLSAGQICTLAGFPGMNDDQDISTIDLETVRMFPSNIIEHPTGGYFVADLAFNVIWFYNTTASSKTVLGSTVAPNHFKILVGNGALGPPGTNGLYTTQFSINTPYGMAWESSTNSLYVAENSNARILKIDSTGFPTVFAGTGSGNGSNVDGAARTAHVCSTPRGLVLDETNNRLFVTCNGTGNNFGTTVGGRFGTVKYFSTNTDAGYTILASVSGQTTYVNGTQGISGTARTAANIYSLGKHPTKDILFVSGAGTCDIVAVSYGSDSETFYGGSLSVTAGNVTRITTTTINANPTVSCGTSIGAYNSAALRLAVGSPNIVVKMNAANTDMEGLIFVNAGNIVGFLNTTTSSVTLGGRTVASSSYSNIAGVVGIGGYNRGVPSFSNVLFTSVTNVFLSQSGSSILIADQGNSALSQFDISVTSGEVTDILRGNYAFGYDGETDRMAQRRLFSTPTRIDYDSSFDQLFVLDTNNGRVRQIDLKSGQVTSAFGAGTSNVYTDPETPSQVQAPSLTDLFVSASNDMLFYVQRISTSGLVPNIFCTVRALNLSDTTDQFYFNQTIQASNVKTVAGNWGLGCQLWSSLYNLTPAISIPLGGSFGVVLDPDLTNMYVSVISDSCILRMNADGTIEQFIGLCGTGGDVMGSFATARLLNPGDLVIDRDSTYQTYGNFFVVDRQGATPSFIKYVNLSPSSVIIGGITIPSMEIGKIYSSSPVNPLILDTIT